MTLPDHSLFCAHHYLLLKKMLLMFNIVKSLVLTIFSLWTKSKV